MAEKEECRTAIIEDTDTGPSASRTYTLDALFKNLGECERFQLIFVPLAYFPLLPPAWVLYFMMFGSYNPGWTCHDNLIFNSTEGLELSNNITMSNIHVNYTFINNETIMSSCDFAKSCKNLTFRDEATTIVTEWALICDDYWIPSFIFSIQMFGVLLGTSVNGYIGDRLGRKFSVHGSAAMLCLTNFIAIFSVSWKMYAAMRFFIGYAAGGLLTSVAVYTFEFIPAWWRAFIGTSPFYNFATLTFGLCVLALKNWRYLHIVTAILSFFAFLPVFWLPESLRFLTVHGKLERAHRIVSKIAKLNRKPVPDTSIMKTVAETEKESMKDRSNYSYFDLFRKSVRKQTLTLGMTWFTLAFGNYMIGFGLKALIGDFFLNFLLFIFLSFLMRLLGPVLITKMGRKYVCALFISLSCLCSFVVGAVQLWSPEEGKGIATLVFALGANMLSEAAFGPVVVLGIELFPTGVRTMAYSFCNSLARIGSIIAPFLIPKENLPIFGSFFILGGIQIIIVIALLSLSESKGRPLPDNM